MTFVKYADIPYLQSNKGILDNNVKIYEKLDGGNCQVRTENWRILAGSRSHYITGKEEYLNSTKDKRKWFGNFLHWTMSNKSFHNLPEKFILFGEWLSKHQVPYDKEHLNKFYAIDLLDLSKGRFIDYDDAPLILTDLGIKDVIFLRKLAEGKFSIKDLEKLVEKSDFYPGVAEGVVIKDYVNQDFAKFLSKPYAEIRDNMDLSFVERYLTPSRLFKVADNLNEQYGSINPINFFNYLQLDVWKDSGERPSRAEIEDYLKKKRKDKDKDFVEFYKQYSLMLNNK
jgi:hypothetical protein